MSHRLGGSSLLPVGGGGGGGQRWGKAAILLGNHFQNLGWFREVIFT